MNSNLQRVASASLLFAVILVCMSPQTDAYKGYCMGKLMVETGSTPFDVINALKGCRGEVRLEIYDREIQAISDGITTTFSNLYNRADNTGFKLAACCGTEGVGCYVNGGAAPRSTARSQTAKRGGGDGVVTYKGVFKDVPTLLAAVKAAGIWSGMVPANCMFCRTSPEAALLKQISDGMAQLEAPMVATSPRGGVNAVPRPGYGK